MRILFLTSTLPRFPGDMQANFVGEQAAAWKAARPDDDIVILAPHDAAAERTEMCNKVEIVRFRYMRPARAQKLAYPAILPNLKLRPWLALQLLPFIIAQFVAARSLVSERRIDLVYAHWVMPQGLVAWWLNRSMGVPYVLQNHSSDLRVFGKLGRIGNALARAIVRRARHLFCVNPHQREHALALFPDDEVIANKVSVLPMGVTPPREGPSGEPAFTFGTISRLSKKKGLHHFIIAADALADKGIKPPIAIAGDGEDAAELKQIARSADIRFPGFLTGDRKERFLDETAVFVMPSVAAGDDVEGMPVSLLEALCRGKRVIASRDTNIRTLPEWPLISDNVFYLEDPSNIDAFAAAMERAVKEVGSAGIRSAQLRRVMSRYLWPNLIRDYLGAIGLGVEKPA